jgi:hypothetical protein
MQRGQIRLEIALQISLEIPHGVPLYEIKSARGEPGNDEHHRDQELRAETGGLRFSFVAQGLAGKST